jgi:hypothetical protein
LVSLKGSAGAAVSRLLIRRRPRRRGLTRDELERVVRRHPDDLK